MREIERKGSGGVGGLWEEEEEGEIGNESESEGGEVVVVRARGGGEGGREGKRGACAEKEKEIE